jgi:hypothetical protein
MPLLAPGMYLAARRREQLGVYPVVRRRDVSEKPRPLAENARRTGHPILCGVKAWASPPGHPLLCEVKVWASP